MHWVASPLPGSHSCPMLMDWPQSVHFFAVDMWTPAVHRQWCQHGMQGKTHRKTAGDAQTGCQCIRQHTAAAPFAVQQPTHDGFSLARGPSLGLPLVRRALGFQRWHNDNGNGGPGLPYKCHDEMGRLVNTCIGLFCLHQ